MKDKVNEGRYRDSWEKIVLVWKDSNLEENQLHQNLSVATICYFVPSDTVFDSCSHLCFSIICSPFSRYSPLFFTITGFSVLLSLLHFHEQGNYLPYDTEAVNVLLALRVFCYSTVSCYAVHTR